MATTKKECIRSTSNTCGFRFAVSKFFFLSLFLFATISPLHVSSKAITTSAAPKTVAKTPTIPGSGAVQMFVRTVADSRRHLVAAAVARSVSIFTMYPMDTIKTRVQMGKKLSFDGLYLGVGGSLFGQVPYGVLTFGSYEIYKKTLLEKFPTSPPIILYALSAILGDVTGSGWLCPSEVIKQQVQGGMHSNTLSAAGSIWKKQGIKGFYQGYFGGLARDVPFRVAQLTSYEVTKNLYLRQKKKWGKLQEGAKLELSAMDSAICGAIAGTFSAAITCPLDRMKTLLMTDSAAYGGSVAACAAKIWRDEGINGFVTGMVPRVTYIAPSVAIFFIAYEQVQQRMAAN